tara:strand:- start:488 stop:1114 length:627 start_codon:yes stop_codon:yes gene_type:complete
MEFIDLGLISFFEALEQQDRTVSKISNCDQKETVYLLEHPHVFTIGRVRNPENLLAQDDWEGHPINPISTNRGGDITYHGPGQLVGYPHLDLRNRGRDVHRYLRNLEETLIRTAFAFGMVAFRRPSLTGVWTEQGKLASIGVGVRHWVTMHGFALNVQTDLRYFELINPCGFDNCQMVSLSSLSGQKIALSVVKRVFKQNFIDVFEGN